MHCLPPRPKRLITGRCSDEVRLPRIALALNSFQITFPRPEPRSPGGPCRFAPARSVRLKVDIEERHRPEDHAVLFDVAVPQREQLGQFVGPGGGQVVDFAGIA